MTVAGTPLQLVAEVRGAAAAGAVLAQLDALAAALSAFETAPELWHIEAYPAVPRLTPELTARLSLAAAAAGGALLALTEGPLPERD